MPHLNPTPIGQFGFMQPKFFLIYIDLSESVTLNVKNFYREAEWIFYLVGITRKRLRRTNFEISGHYQLGRTAI